MQGSPIQRYRLFFLSVLEYSSISFAGLLSSFSGSARLLQKSTVSRSICIPLRPWTEYGRPDGRRSGTLVLSTKKRGRDWLPGIPLEGIKPLLIHVLMVCKDTSRPPSFRIDCKADGVTQFVLFGISGKYTTQ